MVKSRRNRIFGAIAFLVTLSVIAFIFPREGKFRYEYQQGINWPHDDLYAPFDFPIKKSPRELEEDIRRMKGNARQYFTADTNIVSNAKADILSVYDTLSAELRAGDEEVVIGKQLETFRKKIFKALDSIYATGVLFPGPETETKPLDLVISVHSEDNIYQDRFLGSVFTPKQATRYLEKELIGADSLLGPLFIQKRITLTPNIRYDKETTERFREEALNSIPKYRGAIAKNELVISKGEYINAERYNVLESLRLSFNEERGGALNFYSVVIGQVIYVTALMIFLFSFLNIFRQKLFRNFRQTTSVLVLLMMVAFLARATLVSDVISIYVVPFTILPILIRSFYDTRLALFVHIISVLITAYFAPNSYEFVILQMGGGITAIFSFVNFRKRQQLFTTVLLIFLSYAVLYTSLTLMREGTLVKMDYFMFIWFFISCFTTLFCFPLIYIFEKIFGLFSDVTLLELSDTNNSLLRELSAKAPGTFQHSIQVGNLAEAAIEEIGGNALLVRTGALYHDIGKMEEPQYFIENQVAGVNPHDVLDFEVSAEKIISHVTKGIEIARKHKIPPLIVDFIRTHHGTLTVQYFYKNYVKKFPDADTEIDKKKFSYPGPIPFSKETAVLMMADAVEASSRSISEPDMHKIDQLVERIIDYQMAANQFINSDITLRDIRDVKRIFKDRLMTIYHVRIEYPE